MRVLRLSRKMPANLATASRVAAAISAGVAIIVLLGWGLDITVLKSVLPGKVTMKPNTALAFMFCGISLWFAARDEKNRSRFISIVSAYASIIIGTLVLCEYLSGWDLGIDQVLFKEPIGSADTFAPGRMAPASAFNFVLIGTALLICRRPGRQRLASVMVATTWSLSLLATIEYLYDSTTGFGVAAYTRMALHAALTFIVLAGGVFSLIVHLRLREGRSPLSNRFLLRLLPAVVLIPLVLGWLRLQGEKAGFYGTSFGVALMVVVTIGFLSIFVWWNARALTGAEAEQLEAEEALRTSEKRTRLIIDTAYDAFIAIDAGGLIIDWNPQAEKTFGFSRAEALGRLLAETIIPERYRERHRMGLQHFLKTGEGPVLGKPVEISAIDRGGREFPVELTISPVRWGDTWVFNAFIHDITERKEKDALAAASAAKDNFIAALSHELRTPLTPVLATIMGLEAHPDLSPPLQEAVALIQRNVELETRLIDDLLDVTRINKGKLQIERGTVTIHSVLRDAMEICRSELLKKRIGVELDLQATNHFIEGDAPRLLQVFWNLLQNAAKFTPAGGKIHVRTRAKSHDQLKVQIEDTGIGMSPETLSRIFKPFEQADTSISRRFGGLGLGLALSKALVEAHGGQIEATSSGPDQGTLVTVEFPTISPPSLEVVVPHPEIATPARGLRILLVEDHPDSRATLIRLLKKWGHSLLEAGTIAEARQLLKSEKFDLLVADLGLPDGAGSDLMREIRQTSALPGIALSGYGTENDAAQSLEAGFLAHFTKPVGMQKLKAVIDKIARSLPQSD